jgi:hypothetical protein
MTAGKDDCGCGHDLQRHGPTGAGSSHGGPCASCNCGKFVRPTGAELGMINAMGYLTKAINAMVNEMETARKKDDSG